MTSVETPFPQKAIFEMLRIPWSFDAAAAKSLQSCLTLCDPIDGSPLGSSDPGILQKNTGVGCHFLLQCMKVKSQSEVAQSCPILSDLMDCSLPAPLSMGFSRQEYWSGVRVHIHNHIIHTYICIGYIIYEWAFL